MSTPPLLTLDMTVLANAVSLGLINAGTLNTLNQSALLRQYVWILEQGGS
jgi:hypothetical protein